MTLGFAIAAWPKDGDAIVGVAADTRVSANGAALTDAGMKTYELGGRCAAAVSGHALPPMMAAELTRSFVENHNRRTPDRPVGFIDTARLFGFFLKRAAMEQGASCFISIAGFLSTNRPCLAVATVSPGFNRVAFKKIEPGETAAIPVGEPRAARLLLEAMATARRNGRPVVGTALAMLFYIAQLDGAFDSVGGGISVGTCLASGSNFSWPIIEIDGRLFLRGMNVTEHHRASWPKPEALAYDQAWCAAEDQRVSSLPEAPLESATPTRGALPSIDLDAITSENLFATHHDDVSTSE